MATEAQPAETEKSAVPLRRPKTAQMEYVLFGSWSVESGAAAVPKLKVIVPGGDGMTGVSWRVYCWMSPPVFGITDTVTVGESPIANWVVPAK